MHEPHDDLQRTRGQLGLLVNADRGSHWVQVDGSGHIRGSLPAGDAMGWEVHGERLALFGHDWIRWYGPHRSGMEWRFPHGDELLAHGAWSGEVWILVRSTPGSGEVQLALWRIPKPMERREVVHLGDGLATLRGSWQLVPGNEPIVWLVNSLGTVIRFDCVTAERVVTDLQPPVVDCLQDGSGGLFALSPGGLQHLGSSGERLPGQGGFSYLSSCALQGPKN